MKYEIRFSETFPGCTVLFFKHALTVTKSEFRFITGSVAHSGNDWHSAFPEGVGSLDTILCPPGFNTKPFTHDHK